MKLRTFKDTIFDPQNISQKVNKKYIKSYSLHPHIIWKDRYVACMLDNLINQKLLTAINPYHEPYSSCIKSIANYLRNWKTIYKSTKRDSYLYLVAMNLSKKHFLKLLHIENDNGAKEKYTESLKNAKKHVFKTGKTDFIVEYYINKIFMDSIISMDCNEEKAILKARINTIDIGFLAKEAKIINTYLVSDDEVSETTYNNLKVELENSYPYLINRLEAIKAYKESQLQLSQTKSI